MYKIGSHVMYAANGACTVSDIRDESFAGSDRQYYVLTPVGSSSSIFVPTDSEALLSRMRDISTEDEINTLIRQIPGENPEWIPNNHLRNTYFQQVLQSCNVLELFRLTKAIYRRKQELAENGKKNLMADENALRKAEHILFGEISLVLGIQTDEVLPLIESRIAAQ